jgi:DNA-binding NtrC family response regulator
LTNSFIARYSRIAGKSIAGISDDAMERLRNYSWPGNIRQLENAIEQAVVLSNHPVLTLDDLPQEIREDLPPVYDQAAADEVAFSDTPALDEMKKRYVLFVLKRCRGNMSRAAKVLDVDRRSLYRMLARWKVEPSPER